MNMPTLCHQDFRSVGSSYSIECVLHHNVELQLKYTSMILGIDFILMKCETNMTKTSSVVDSSIVLFSALPLLVRELQTPAK